MLHKVTVAQRISISHMRTPTSAICLIPHFLALSNTDGCMDIRTSNQNRCGRDSIGCGPPALKGCCRKASASNGMTTSMLLTGTGMPFTCRLRNSLGVVKDWFFVGWPSLGCRRQLILMYMTITQAAEGQIITRSYQTKLWMSYSKTPKS